MGLMSWLFGSKLTPAVSQDIPRSAPKTRRPVIAIADLPGPGTFSVEVVGESRYLHAFELICGSRNPDGEDLIVQATLVHEDENPYDHNAVRVEIQGRSVGYLPRDTARSYRERLSQAGHGGITAACAANIRGGWDRGGGERGYYGVWLDLPVDES